MLGQGCWATRSAEAKRAGLLELLLRRRTPKAERVARRSGSRRLMRRLVRGPTEAERVARCRRSRRLWTAAKSKRVADWLWAADLARLAESKSA